MDWAEAYRLAQLLMADPSSQLCAAVNGWDHPFSREAIALADVFDLQRGKNDRYPRPWDRTTRRIGRPSIPQEQVRQVLRSLGHDI
jgi:hypothetical protein